MDCRGQSRAATRPAPQSRSSPISRTIEKAVAIRRLLFASEQRMYLGIKHLSKKQIPCYIPS